MVNRAERAGQVATPAEDHIISRRRSQDQPGLHGETSSDLLFQVGQSLDKLLRQALYIGHIQMGKLPHLPALSMDFPRRYWRALRCAPGRISVFKQRRLR